MNYAKFLGEDMPESQKVTDPTPAPPLEGRGYEHPECVQSRHIGLFQVNSSLFFAGGVVRTLGRLWGLQYVCPYKSQ